MHWRAPTTILLSLLCGGAFTVGHHFFYRSLAGGIVHTSASAYRFFGTDVSPQQVNIAGGELDRTPDDWNRTVLIAGPHIARYGIRTARESPS